MPKGAMNEEKLLFKLFFRNHFVFVGQRNQEKKEIVIAQN
jgi:hypothetical protein